MIMDYFTIAGSKGKPKKQKIVSALRKFLIGLGLHTLLARLKRNLFLKIRENFGRDDFYKHASFQYGGNRAVLRCILRKKSK